jgi:isoleucyl-tRNA synthetase
MLGNLYDFDPGKDAVPREKMGELDRLMLHRLEELKARLKRGYEEFSFHVVQQGLHNFCAVDLSGFYLDIIKDRLYTSAAKSPARRAAQTVLHRLVLDLVRLMAPILSFTAEEVWDHLPGAKAAQASVHLAGFPEADAGAVDAALAERWEKLAAVRAEVNKALDVARKEKIVGNSLEARLVLAGPEDVMQLIQDSRDRLLEITMVSELVLGDVLDHPDQAEKWKEALPGTVESSLIPGLLITIEASVDPKCSRCWMRRPDVSSETELCDRCQKAVKA